MDEAIAHKGERDDTHGLLCIVRSVAEGHKG